jgi:DNA-binding response OmpR family regulator
MEQAVKKVFLVEDDPNFGSVLKAYLELNDFDVIWENDGECAIATFNENSFDICLLDVMLPNVDGFTIADDIRNLKPSIPIIFITAKSLKQDILKGYNVGADDYITKPFDSELLILKINAILNRLQGNNPGEVESHIFTIGRFTFDYSIRSIISGEDTQKLSPKEAELLRLLCIHSNDLLARELALKAIWGEDGYFTTRSMDVYITKLRKYLSADPNIKILNIHGSGFRLITS